MYYEIAREDSLYECRVESRDFPSSTDAAHVVRTH